MAECSGKIVSNNVNLQIENITVEHSESVEENKTEAVMEPMLLEDYREDKLPRSLQNLLNNFKQEGVLLDLNDIAVIFIYILMLETGFVIPDSSIPPDESTCDFHYKRLLLLTNKMPNNWKQNNVTYSLSFCLVSFPRNICTITCVCASDDLVVNCTINNISRVNLSLLLDPSMYIVNSFNKGTLNIFQNLQGLSQQFKNLVSYPCKKIILEAHSQRPATLLKLPLEIFSKIVGYCDKKSNLYLNQLLYDG